MITKLSIKLLQIIMYPQLKWYTKMCFCGNRTLVQMLLSDKFQKGCNGLQHVPCVLLSLLTIIPILQNKREHRTTR